MRLGLVTSSFSLGPADTTNAGVFARDLAEALSSRGLDVHVLTPRKIDPPSRKEPFTVVPIYWWGTFQDLASASPRNPLKMVQLVSLLVNGALMVSRYAREKRLETLLALWAIPSGFFCLGASNRLGIPYGVWALGSDIWSRKKYPGGDRLVKKVLNKAAFRFADGIQLAKEVERLAGAPSEFVPSFRRLIPTGDTTRPDLDYSLTQFLFIGRYEWNKGPDILIKAMKKLLASGSQAQLHLFGAGSMEKSLHFLGRGAERNIQIHGVADTTTVRNYMSCCHWLIIPSRIESIPLIFGDALQMRIPVIGTEVGDLGNLIRSLNVGRVAAAADPETLAQLMMEVESQPRPREAWGWEEARTLFDPDLIVQSCCRALEQASR